MGFSLGNPAIRRRLAPGLRVELKLPCGNSPNSRLRTRLGFDFGAFLPLFRREARVGIADITLCGLTTYICSSEEIKLSMNVLLIYFNIPFGHTFGHSKIRFFPRKNPISCPTSAASRSPTLNLENPSRQNVNDAYYSLIRRLYAL